MIGRNVDLIAIVALLVATALFSQARKVVLVTLHGPVRYWQIDTRRQDERQLVRVPMSLPAVPQIPIHRD